MGIKKFTFGTPEKCVPSRYCDKFNYTESEISYPASNFTYRQTSGGAVIEFPVEDDCRMFGFGLQLNLFSMRARSVKLSVNADPETWDGDSHAPVPFFATNKGFGMYFDTARYAEFFCGKQKNDASGKEIADGGAADTTDELYADRGEVDCTMSVRIPGAGGIDIYVIEGENITDIVKQYNMLSGGGPDVPEWGLGMIYRMNSKWDAEKIKETVDYFAEKDIPCGVIGLEPGWQTHAYSCTYKWSELFPDPDGFIKYMRDRGIHINLWEHAFTHPTADFHNEIAPYSGDYLVWGGLVPDFATAEGKKIFADYHRRYLTSHGIDGFKLDECDSSDNTGCWSFPLSASFPSGMDGEQYHSMFGVLYSKAILEALDGRQTYGEARNMGALAASYPFALYSDLYDHRMFINGVVTAGFSGLLWTPEVRSADSAKELIRRMQALVFSAQFLMNPWNYDAGIPWVALDCEDEARELIKLRASLVPMLKAAFDEYRDTGKPPIRALIMDYTDDKEALVISDEYLFCDDLLVAPIIWKGRNTPDERDVYLPTADRWVDFFTGDDVDMTPPEGKPYGWIHVKTTGIPVFKRIK